MLVDCVEVSINVENNSAINEAQQYQIPLTRLRPPPVTSGECSVKSQRQHFRPTDSESNGRSG